MSLTSYGQGDLVDLLLSMFWAVSRSRDRGGSVPLSKIHHATGLPESANDLVPSYQAPSGIRLAMEYVVNFDMAASACLSRSQLSSEGIEETVELGQVPGGRENWTQVELEAHADLVQRLTVAALKAADESKYFAFSRELDVSGETVDAISSGCGLPDGCRLTWEGWKACEAKMPGSKYDRRTGLKDAVTAETWRQAPDWARQGA